MGYRSFSRLLSLAGIFVLLLVATSPAGAAPPQAGSDLGLPRGGVPALDGKTPGLSTGTDIVLIVAGGDHMCSLTSSGAVKCWGRNDRRQLGAGTLSPFHTIPMPVVGLSSGVQGLAAGALHTCALTTGGAVKCWGAGNLGQIGDGGTAQAPTPVGVYGLSSGIKAIGAGNDFTCALTSAGGVKCWGFNENGQLGDNSTTPRLTPVDVPGLANIAAIAVGAAHVCALTNTGGVKCWGNNNRGQLGDNTNTERHTPVDVIDLTGASALAAGFEQTCAVTSAGGVVCWGDNNFGQLGIGSPDQFPHPAPEGVSGLTAGITALAQGAGAQHNCALTDPFNGPPAGRGKVKCWGYNNYGQLGIGSTDDSPVPVEVTGLSGMIAITAGWSSTCALTGGGQINCWGKNSFGQLGDATTTNRTTPVLATNPHLFLSAIFRK